MKKTLLSTLILAVSSYGSEVPADIGNLQIFQETGSTITRYEKIDDMHHVKGNFGNGQTFEGFINADKSKIIIGKGFDIKTGKPYQFPLRIDPDNAAFTVGQGDYDYYVFTDPECPYCKKFEKQLAQAEELREKATFHFFLSPLPSHKNAKAMSRYILSQPKHKRFEALRDTDSGDWENYSATGEKGETVKSLLRQHLSIAKEAGVRGTPTVYDAQKQNKVQRWPDLFK